MFLADLNPSALSSEVIESLIIGLQHELRLRKATERFKITKASGRKFAHAQQRLGCRSYEEEVEHLTLLYSSALYALPRKTRQEKISYRLRYLSILLAQDWTSISTETQTNTTDYYVYAHVDPRKKPTPLEPLHVILPGEPFYIGKGSGRRAWDLKRNQGHGKRIQRLRALGYTDKDLVAILVERLSEQEALLLEAKLIYLFGSIYDETVKGILLNLADHIRPTFPHIMERIPERDIYHQYLQRLLRERYGMEHPNY